MFFRSERLFLRPGWPEDWSTLFSQIADADIVRDVTRAPWPEHARNARDLARTPQDRRFPHFLVTLPGTADGEPAGTELIGCIGLFRRESGVPALGTWIARHRRRQGYATEAARAVLSIARTLGHRRVEAHDFADNRAARRVFAKLGFRPVGARRTTGAAQPAVATILALELAGATGGDDDGSGGEKMAMRRVA